MTVRSWSGRRKALGLYLVLVHLLLAILLSRYVVPRVQAYYERWPDPAPSAHYDTMVSMHLASDALVPPGRIVLLGDSHGQALAASAISPLALNYGIGTDDTRGILQRLPDYSAVAQARAVILEIGINDMKFATDQQLLDRYALILDQLAPKLVTFCTALLPIHESSRQDWESRSNRRIRTFNDALNKLCDARGAHFIAVPGELFDARGDLAAAFHAGDGLHLNTRGYRLWAQALRQALAGQGLPVAGHPLLSDP